MKIGILGCGQLARMLTLAAVPLGIETVSYVSNKNDSGNKITPIFGYDFNDHEKLKQFAESVDIITYETENIDLDAVKYLAQFKAVHPNIKALEIFQDRQKEKEFVNQLGIKTCEFHFANNYSDLEKFAKNIRLPCLIKTTRFGYDGKGQYKINQLEDFAKLRSENNIFPVIIEQWVDFDCELALISVRDKNNNLQFYPLTQTTHKHGILRLAQAPYANQLLQSQAENIAEIIMTKLDYIGVMAIELFKVDNELLINEIAPRVHNSGHWTIEGAHTSQFENHLRALFNLPLGNTAAKGYSAMINCISHMPDIKSILCHYTHYHDYAKAPRANRKLGHITINHEDESVVLAVQEKIHLVF